MQIAHLEKKLRVLKLAGMLQTLAMRLSQAQAEGWSYVDFTERILEDEMEGRATSNVAQRLGMASFVECEALEDFELATCRFIDRHEHVILEGQVGRAGVAIGHAACRKGFSTSFVSAARLFADMRDERRDAARDRRLRSYLAPDLLIINDLGPCKLTRDQAEDFHELVMARHLTGSMVVTSTLPLEEWIDLFPDRVVGLTTLDRLARAAHHISVRGLQYRKTFGYGPTSP